MRPFPGGTEMTLPEFDFYPTPRQKPPPIPKQPSSNWASTPITVVRVLILLTLVGVVAYLVMPGGNNPAAKNEKEAEIQPNDDLEVFLLKYGNPDSVESTENDNPRPPIVTRFLICATPLGLEIDLDAR